MEAIDAMGVQPGADGRSRCWWCLASEDFLVYHDEEWGRPLHGEAELFERVTLEAFQSGLSWLTILRKRENFRAAFDRFEVERIAEYGAEEVDRLLDDAGIVRNRRKIEATISNARATRELHAGGETLDELMWAFMPDPGSRPAPRSGHDLESQTAESTAMAKELKRRGFVFVGPTTCHALMQAAGMVNDHLDGCAFRDLALSAESPGAPGGVGPRAAPSALITTSLRMQPPVQPPRKTGAEGQHPPTFRDRLRPWEGRRGTP